MNKLRLIKHNPAFLSKEELTSSFVVRNRELELLMEIIRNNTGPVNQHVIIIAPRGMGKTMLVRRLALKTQQDEALSQNWYPVVLPEELYDVASEGELWLRVLQWIGEQEKTNDQGRMLDKHAALSLEQEEKTLKIQALGALLEFAGQKRLLIIVENLQMLLGEQSSDDDAWNIRQTLLNNPELMMVSTATTHFGEIRNVKKANFELFREIRLAPLDTDASRVLWETVSGENLEEIRIRPMEILTGGSPRLLSILADFGAGRPFKELMENLVVLIDDHTTYFKANVEALPNKERRVFVTLAELWEPSMTKDVAKRCRLNVNMVSALLKRLEQKGAVTKVARKGRAHYYQITERLYNIYHLMRLSGNAGDRVQALVRCMIPIYGEAAIACTLARETCQTDADLRPLFIEEYGSILKETSNKADLFKSIVENTPQEFFQLSEAKHLKPLLKNDLTHEESTSKITLLFNKNVDLIQKGNFSEAVKACDQLIEQFNDAKETVLLEQVAKALFNKGFALGSMDRSEEALLVYDEVLERFGNSKEIVLLEPVAKALFNKGFALRTMDRSEEALLVYDEVLERFGNSKETVLLEQVAKALVNKGVTLGTMDRSEEALLVYDEVLERFGNSKEIVLLEYVASAHNSKAWGIYQQKDSARLDEAIEEVQKAIRISPDNNDFHHTLACVYGLANQWSGAFEQALIFSNDLKLIQKCPDEILDFFIEAAAAGEIKTALTTIERTIAAKHFEPLVAALKILENKNFHAPKEVMEVAFDIVNKIKKL